MNENLDKSKTDPFDGYVRPNQKWVCGRGSHECDCPLGPIARGRCGSQSETKCRPRQSLREKRKLFTIGVTLLVTGIVLIGCWQPWRADFLAPGPLSSSHAQLFHGQTNSENRCAACHEAADQNPTEWLLSAFTGGNHIEVPQSSKCMECHAETLVADLALAAHNVNAHELQRIAKSQVATNRVSIRLFKPADHFNSEIACAACHREHHGKDHDLARLTDTQCQSCHTNQFKTFDFDHPDFGDWTKRVSLGIEFDHASHLRKHFPDKSSTFDCKQCHIEDARGNVQMLSGFEKSCATCHEQSIEGNLSDGIDLVRLPMLDPQSFAAAGLDIGSWPENASGDFDGAIPPLMQVLLVADPDAKIALERLGADFEFFDLNIDDADQMAAAAELVWAIKRLIGELAIKGEASVRERLELSLSRRPDRATDHTNVGNENGGQMLYDPINTIAGRVSQSALIDLKEGWFPELQQELARHVALNADIRLATFQNAASKSTGVEQQLLLKNPLKKKYPANLPVVTQPGEDVRSLIPQPTSEEGTSGAEHRTDQGAPTENAESILLLENPLKGYGTQTEVPPAIAHEIKLHPATQDSTQDVETDPVYPVPTNPNSPEEIVRAFLASQEYPAGKKVAVWSRDDQTLSLTYRPAGHGDTFVQAWLDALLEIREGDNPNEQALLSTLKQELNPMAGTGYCLSCHGSPAFQRTDIAFASWKATYRDTNRRGFTRFDHGPHLLQTSLRDCQSCHVIDELEPDFASINSQSTKLKRVAFHESNGSDPHGGKFGNGELSHSDFIAISKSNCVKCHNQTAVSQSCTQCHGYHVGSKILK